MWLSEAVPSNDQPARPVYITETVIEQVMIPVTDTLSVHDTLYMYLSRTQKVYEDEDYKAYVSSIRPALDSISIYRQTETVIQTEVKTIRTQPRWSLGAGVGVGAAYYGGKVVLSPYIGVQVSYNLLTWQEPKKSYICLADCVPNSALLSCPCLPSDGDF